MREEAMNAAIGIIGINIILAAAIIAIAIHRVARAIENLRNRP